MADDGVNSKALCQWLQQRGEGGIVFYNQKKVIRQLFGDLDFAPFDPGQDAFPGDIALVAKEIIRHLAGRMERNGNTLLQDRVSLGLEKCRNALYHLTLFLVSQNMPRVHGLNQRDTIRQAI